MSDYVSLKLNEPLGLNNNVPSAHVFHFNGKWLLEISHEGIKFNHDDFPDFTSDDFAEKFISILEKIYHLNFERRSNE